MFFCEFYEISKNIVFTEHLRETAFIFSSAMLFSSVDNNRQMCKEWLIIHLGQQQKNQISNPVLWFEKKQHKYSSLATCKSCKC